VTEREDAAFPSPPPAVEVEFDEPVRGYWARRADQVMRDSYAGVQMFKFPEDLRVYEHLMWLSRPDVVIEIGAYFGGSSLWFRDRLRALAGTGGAATPAS
jgi:cephalosporin hydroxylase